MYLPHSLLLQVLGAYPTTIRRRVLRCLYLGQVRACYLFPSVRQRFLDALLAASRLELFLPNVDILSEGDFVNELFIVASGELQGFRASTAASPEVSRAAPGLLRPTQSH